MGLRRERIADLRRAVGRVLLELGAPADAPWFDATLGHGGGEGPFSGGLLRVRRTGSAASPEAMAADDGYWLWLTPDGARCAPLRDSSVEHAQVAAASPRCTLEVHDESAPDDRYARRALSTYASRLELVIDDGERFTVGDWWACKQADARRRAEAARDNLDAWLRRVLPPESALPGSQPGASDTLPDPCGVDAASMSRLVLRREGTLLVLRDMASRGPREPAVREVVLACGLCLAAVALAAAAWLATDALRVGVLIAIAAVCGIASFAVVHIAKHSLAYGLHNEALLYFGADRFVLAPWVSREGVVDDKPEGQYGAALPYAEWHDIALESSGDVHRLVLHTDHGPYVISAFAHVATAKAWRKALMAVAADVAGQAPHEAAGD
jgi:hypothetical protein